MVVICVTVLEADLAQLDSLLPSLQVNKNGTQTIEVPRSLSRTEDVDKSNNTFSVQDPSPQVNHLVFLIGICSNHLLSQVQETILKISYQMKSEIYLIGYEDQHKIVNNRIFTPSKFIYFYVLQTSSQSFPFSPRSASFPDLSKESFVSGGKFYFGLNASNIS